MSDLNNLYNNLTNFYNVNDENFKEFMAKFYEDVLTNHRDIKYIKEHLQEEIKKKVGEYFTVPKTGGEKEQTLNLIVGGFWNQDAGYIQTNDSWTAFYYNKTPISVKSNEEFRIVNAGGSSNLYPILFANSKELDKQNRPIIKAKYPTDLPSSPKVFSEIKVTVPENVDLMYINSYIPNGTPTSNVHLYKITKDGFVVLTVEDIVNMNNNVNDISSNFNKIKEEVKPVDDMKFELDNLRTKCTKYDNFQFTWKTFDKVYFAITIDDSNKFLAGFYDVAHGKNVPISTACIHTNLNVVEDKGTRTIRQINNLIIADGGEILAHYSGSPSDETPIDEWLTYTKDVKKALMKEGWNIRGLIKADSTQIKSNKGEQICRKYYDYSDQIGISPQYNLGGRKMLIGVQTLDDFKTWVDNCCKINGFYVICVHGGRNDEPLATNGYLGQIIDYINSKTNTEFTTYAKVFDKFGYTTVEKKLNL